MEKRGSTGRVLFHLAFPIHDLEEAKRFYVDGLGCTLGRESSSAITLGLEGHQIVGHLTSRPPEDQKGIYPRHFGLVFTSEKEWRALAERAKAKSLSFRQEPRRRFPGTRLEHATFFLEDPFGNLLEFKHYAHDSAIFGERDSPQVGDADEAL
jgi:extradiol dioxygenase family protein